MGDNDQFNLPGFNVLKAGKNSPKNVIYIVSDSKYTCNESKAPCEQLGLGRAEFRSEEEEKFLMEYAKSRPKGWYRLGAKVTQDITRTGDASDRTKYAWDSDESAKVKTNNWFRHTPEYKVSAGDDACLMISKFGILDSKPSNWPTICE